MLHQSNDEIQKLEIKKLTDFYTKSLANTNAVLHSSDYARLAHYLIKIIKEIDLTGKYSKSKANIAIVQKYGFRSFECLLDYLIKEINNLNLHGFKIRNRRLFIEKLKSFIALNPPSEEALLSLVPKKFGKTNNSKWTSKHQEVLDVFITRQIKNLHELSSLLNSEFEKLGLVKLSHETIKNNARKRLVSQS